MRKPGRVLLRGIGLGTAGLLLGTAGAVTAASAAAPEGEPPVLVCGLNAAALGRPPLTLGFGNLHKVYLSGGHWSGFRLEARNRTRGTCSGIRPVVAYGARSRALRPGDVRLQWRRSDGSGKAGSGRWHSAPMVSEAGVLVGVVGPEQGLTLSAKGGVAVLLRMRFRHGAPLGEWMTMTIGYEPVSLDGQTVPVPVGVSDPRLFRVQRHGGGAGDGSATGSDSATGSGRGSRGGAAAPQLAATGASATTGRAAGAAALATVGGVGLVGYSRRRRRS